MKTFALLILSVPAALAWPAVAGAPRLARRFDTIDSNRDGRIKVDEFAAARKTRGTRKSWLL